MDALAPAPARCVRCGHAAAADDLVCSLCGELLARAPAPPKPGVHAATPPTSYATAPRGEGTRLPPTPAGSPWLFLAAGLLLAPVLTFTPLLQYMGWFLASLFHESSPAAIGWALG